MSKDMKQFLEFMTWLGHDFTRQVYVQKCIDNYFPNKKHQFMMTKFIGG